MSGKDMQRTMDFILNQQAQFAANIQHLGETQIQLTMSQATAEGRVNRIEKAVIELVEVVERLASTLGRIETLVAKLSEAQAQTEASIRELASSQAQTEASIRELASSQAQTQASIRELASSQAQTQASIRELADSHARLAGGQEHTDQRLNTLINVVERYISSRAEGDLE